MERAKGIEPVTSSLVRPNAVDRLDELRTNRAGSIEFVHLVSGVRGLCKLNS